MTAPRIVYVIESESDPTRYYIGLTADLARRIEAHNTGRSRYTRSFRPLRLVVRVEFAMADRAVQFERYLKSHSGRAFLSRHIR